MTPKIRGVYLKRGKYVYQAPMVGGVRPALIHLGTSDLATALQMREQIIRSEFVAQKTQPLRAMVENFLKIRSAAAKWSPFTLRAHAANLRRFEVRFSGRTADSITGSDLLKWRDSMAAEHKPLSPASIHAYLTSVRALFSWLVKSGQLLRHPFDGFADALLEKNLPTRRANFCDKALRDHLINSCQHADMKAVLWLGFHAGLRRGEILAARPSWIIRDSGGFPTHLHVRNESGGDGGAAFRIKDGEEKMIPLNDPLARFLHEFIDQPRSQSTYIIAPHIKPGTSPLRWDWKRRWRTFMRAEGCEWVTPHTMRHTFVTLLLSSPPEVRPSLLHIERWTGTDTETLKKSYAHLIEDRSLINAAN